MCNCVSLSGRRIAFALPLIIALALCLGSCHSRKSAVVAKPGYSQSLKPSHIASSSYSRLPDATKRLMAEADTVASNLGIRLMHGVYVGTPGPTFETPAEYEYFRVIGGDAVGMSTVPEVIVANHAGMRVYGISVITDLGGKDIKEVPTHEEVQLAAQKAQPNMLAIIKGLVASI